MEKSIGTEDDTKQQLEKQLARSRRQLQVQAADLQKLQVRLCNSLWNYPPGLAHV